MMKDLESLLRMASYSNVLRKWHLTRRKESRDPFSMYSTTIITGLPAKTAKECVRIMGILRVSYTSSCYKKIICISKVCCSFYNPPLVKTYLIVLLFLSCISSDHVGRLTEDIYFILLFN